jgi:hypothetical protein
MEKLEEFRGSESQDKPKAKRGIKNYTTKKGASGLRSILMA